MSRDEDAEVVVIGRQLVAEVLEDLCLPKFSECPAGPVAVLRLHLVPLTSGRAPNPELESHPGRARDFDEHRVRQARQHIQHAEQVPLLLVGAADFGGATPMQDQTGHDDSFSRPRLPDRGQEDGPPASRRSAASSRRQAFSGVWAIRCGADAVEGAEREQPLGLNGKPRVPSFERSVGPFVASCACASPVIQNGSSGGSSNGSGQAVAWSGSAPHQQPAPTAGGG
jgi:hypothetical protein